jgi:hypothetical protein
MREIWHGSSRFPERIEMARIAVKQKLSAVGGAHSNR